MIHQFFNQKKLLLFVATVYAMTANATAQDITQPVDLTFIERWEELDKNISETRSKSGHWLLGEYDFDSRGFNVLHFMGASAFPGGFRIWGLLDIEGIDHLATQREDLSRYFLEIDIKRALYKNVGVVAELNDLTGDNNAIGRFGFFWTPDTSFLSNFGGWWLTGDFKFGIKAFPYETDGEGGQFSFNWNKNFENILGGRISAGGFFDLNLNAGPMNDSTVIVTEHQIRLRFFDNIHLITEFRWNQFLAADFGVAPGIQYRY
ncbi:MAG: hypothetical protein AAF497_01190 [Planctomycetota bacterium]